MEYKIPKDSVMLLSFINTQLRDHFDSFEELCVSLGVVGDEIKDKLAAIDYEYDAKRNQFI